MELFLVRHGQTDQNKMKKIQGRRDFPLNETGKEEAKALGLWLKKNNMKFDVIMSSPLIRAKETAQIIKDVLMFEQDVIINENFIERSFGECEGLDVCDEVFVNILNDKAIGLEKSDDIKKRVIDECMRMNSIYSDKKVLVVSHSHTIKALACAVDDSYKFNDKLNNCGLCHFKINSNDIKILRFNVKTI
ncbi:MAG: histidine phosphatase family protein [Anaeroplasmataceae bacterium]